MEPELTETPFFGLVAVGAILALMVAALFAFSIFVSSESNTTTKDNSHGKSSTIHTH